MNKLAHGLVVGCQMFLLCAWASWADDYAFPDTVDIIASRSFQPDPAGPADTLLMTMSISNAEADSVRNLYFSDHLPAEFFDIDTRQVSVNGVELADTAYLYEAGQLDEVFLGARPHRWVIESPPDSAGLRRCSHILNPSTGILEIIYAVRCTTNGQHRLPGYTWAGQMSGTDGQEIFGYSDSVLISVSDVPGAVGNLVAQKAASSLCLSWGIPWDDVGINYYVIYRDTVSVFTSLDGDSIAATTDTFFIDDIGGVGDPSTNRF
jgi:hypothetical protein